MKKFQVRHSEIQQLCELKNHGQPVSIVPKVKIFKSSRIFYYKFITCPSAITSWYKRNVSLRSHSYQILGSIVGLINWISGCLFFDFCCLFFLVFSSIKIHTSRRWWDRNKNMSRHLKHFDWFVDTRRWIQETKSVLALCWNLHLMINLFNISVNGQRELAKAEKNGYLTS